MDASEPEVLLKDGAVTLAGATREFGIGRSTLYRLMARGELAFTSVGDRRLIPREALRRLLLKNLVLPN